MTLLQQAIKAAGGRSPFAAALGVSKQRVHYWVQIGHIPKVEVAAKVRQIWGIDLLDSTTPSRKRKTAPLAAD